MGKTKRLFENEQSQFEEFFDEPEYLTFDVRVTAKIHLPSFDSLIDTDSALKRVKKDLRKVMISQFRKELSKQIKDQL